MTNKDVQIAYLMKGASVLGDLEASRNVMLSALEELRASDAPVEEFEAWLNEQGLQRKSRGRTAASAGDRRVYSAQQIKTGGPFLRLPVEALGVEKGGRVHVAFDKDRLVVTAA